jgi:hypothetical protein
MTMSNESGIDLKDLIEPRILCAVRKLLTGRVNELMQNAELKIPVIDDYLMNPTIELTSCEQTEKERIIRVDAYSLTITFLMPDTPESELHCYAYAGAISRVIYENPTLGGVAERVSIAGRKYIKPTKSNCGEEWRLVISLRITVEC